MEMIIKYTVTMIILIFTTKQKILKRLKNGNDKNSKDSQRGKKMCKWRWVQMMPNAQVKESIYLQFLFQ